MAIRETLSSTEVSEEIRRLGPQRAIYQPAGQMLLGTVVLLAMAGPGLLLIGCFGYGMIWPPPEPDVTVGAVILGFGLLLMAMGVGFFRYARRTNRFRVFVHDGGLVSFRRGAYEVFPWDAITEVYQTLAEDYPPRKSGASAYLVGLVVAAARGLALEVALPGGSTLRPARMFVLHRADGARLRLGDFWDRLSELGLTILRETTRRQLPPALEAFDAGNAVRFGPLLVSREAIEFHRDHLPGAEFGGFAVKKGTLYIRRKGRLLSWHSVRTGKVPNFLLLLTLGEELLRAQRDESARAVGAE